MARLPLGTSEPEEPKKQAAYNQRLRIRPVGSNPTLYDLFQKMPPQPHKS
ncbi:hypothetical protein EI77_04270 [Prosthecobacter fusiformis]|uniref:Uncharacterized protein n=1 Tax=Prosthecobacter fusiformis TaxID=48464 RepID=A0A4R7RK63_9BACT|nr:hypothetical protein EI77_04270 [Prosthecobacter fusiformis]